MKKLLLAISACALLGSTGYAQTISGAVAEWNTFGNAGTETTEASSFSATGLTAGALSLGAGVTAAANGNRFGGSGWYDTGDGSSSTLANAITGNDYIQFTITPTAGFSVSLTSFTFKWDFSGTGPNTTTLRSSADSFAADLGSVTATTSTTVFRTMSISLANLTTATTFRLYGYGTTNTASAGTGGFDTASPGTVANVGLVGTITAVPEPHEYGIAFAGMLVALIVVRRRKASQIA